MYSDDYAQRNWCRSCGKGFTQANALSNHLRSCKKSRSQLHHALVGARKLWAEGRSARKRLKTTHPAPLQDDLQRGAAARDVEMLEVARYALYLQTTCLANLDLGQTGTAVGSPGLRSILFAHAERLYYYVYCVS
jgi:hypothetical protein